MHALLVFSSLLVVVLGGVLALTLLHRLDGWPRRRQVHLAVLAAPVIALGLSLAGLHHFLGQTCFLRTASWDYIAGVALPIGMALVALGGLILSVTRLAAVHLAFRRKGVPADPEIQRLADQLAGRLSTARPRVLLCGTNRPLALTFGLQRPTIILSRWMVEALDSKELESVLAHEVGHVSRGDFLATWMATILRDAFFYLPTSAAAYRQFQYERELACDDLAARATGRPLALASALAKVWQHGLSWSLPQPVQTLAGPDDGIEQRIQRLLASSATNPSPRSRWVFPGLGLQSLFGLAALLVANALVMLVPMGCGPGSLI